VQAVLEEFFSLQDDGWHNARCDAEIAKFQDGEPEREAKKSNEEARLKRHREERARLFSLLNKAGLHAPWNISMGELREMVKALPVTQPDTHVPPLPATAPATPATATQAPVPRHQTPDPELKDKGARPDATTLRALAEGTAEPEDPAIGAGTRYGLAARAMRQKGCAATPGDPRLRQLVDQGASLEEFEAVGAEAADKGKGPAWALTALINRRREAADVRLASGPTAPTWQDTRDGVSSRGQALGLGAWQDFERESMAKGVSPRYDAYRKRVLEADQAEGVTP
jgi:hypothetical protein